MKVILFATHPVQYQAPIYKELAKEFNLTVIYMHRQEAKDQAKSGFGVNFEWDIPLYEGYDYEYVQNESKSPSTARFFGIKLSNIGTLFNKYRPDKVIVQGWFPYGYLQVINYCKRHRIEVICRGDSNLLMRSNGAKKVVKFLYMSWLLGRIDKFLFVGSQNKAFYKHYGVPEDKLIFAPHCIDTGYFDAQFKKCDVTTERKISIGFAGKFIDKKQPVLLIEALSRSRYKRDCQIVFVGDGPLKHTMSEMVKNYEMEAHFEGFLNQSEIVQQGYCKMDVLVLPSSFNETWGLVVNEAMTGGIPCIVSDKVGCAIDLIEDGVTGFVFKSGDIADLTRCLDRLVEMKKQGHGFHADVKKKISAYSLANCIQSIQSALTNYKDKG